MYPNSHRIFTGIVSGMLGIGGGFIMSPAQYWLLQETVLQHDIEIRIAFGTTLFVVLLNAINVAHIYHQKNVVLWKQTTIIGFSDQSSVLWEQQ